MLNNFNVYTEPAYIHKISCMSFFGNKLTALLQEIGMTKYKLAKDSDVPQSSVINISNGKQRATDDIINKFASVKELGVDKDTLVAWRAVDELPKSVLKKALELSEGMPPEMVKAAIEEAEKRRGK
jgi:predicted transcriptional regulator